jgi:hypothetical protein
VPTTAANAEAISVRSVLVASPPAPVFGVPGVFVPVVVPVFEVPPVALFIFVEPVEVLDIIWSVPD